MKANSDQIRVLHLEDDDFDAELVRLALEREQLNVVFCRAACREDFLAAWSPGKFDLILADHNLSGFTGLEALEIVRQADHEIPFISVSGMLGEEVAIDTLKQGATDYVLKQRLSRLGPAVRRAIAEARIKAERKQAQERLRESEQRYRVLTEVSPQVVWFGRADGYMTYFNQSWYDYTGLKADETMGDGWMTAIHPEQRQSARRAWDQAVKRGVNYEAELRLARADGVYRWHLARGLAIRDASNAVVQWIGVAVDIDDQKRAMEHAETANRVKDHFLATLSHELRTPLNAIVGWAQLMRMGKMSDEERQQGIEIIDRNAKIQAKLIEDLLDISRIISGKLRLEVGPVDLIKVIEEALATVAPAARSKGVRMGSMLDSSIGRISGDEARLHQIVWNLLSNAVKFTPKGGNIQIRLDRVRSEARIVVEDDGQGISPDFLPYVFDRFRQADSAATTRSHSGLGLGLSIVRHLVELHGGRVEVFSAGAGRGSTFTVLLPINAAWDLQPQDADRRPDAESTAECPPELAGVRILVVDDEADSRDMLARLLSECGADVSVAGSVQAALEEIERQPPQILVSDIGMPYEDGYQLIRKLRNQGKSARELPAVALTAFARSEDRTRAVLAGFQVHMSKPVNPVELAAVIASLVGRTGVTK